MPRTFPTPWTAYLHRYQEGAQDDEGNPLNEWIPAKDQPGIPFRVITWAPIVAMDVEANRPTIRYELIIPARIRHAVTKELLSDPRPRDVIDLPEDNPFGIARFEVQGWTRDYTKGFHGWEAGKVVDLTRT